VIVDDTQDGEHEHDLDVPAHHGPQCRLSGCCPECRVLGEMENQAVPGFGKLRESEIKLVILAFSWLFLVLHSCSFATQCKKANGGGFECLGGWGLPVPPVFRSQNIPGYICADGRNSEFFKKNAWKLCLETRYLITTIAHQINFGIPK